MLKAIFKKSVALVLTLSILFCGLSFNALAVTPEIVVTELTLYTANSGVPSTYAEVDNSDEALIESINSQLKNFAEQVNIYNFRLSGTDANIQKIVSILSYSLPECFHINMGFSIASMGAYIYSIIPKYSCTKEEYALMLAECEAVVDEMLAGVADNSSLTDVQKLLILHDRIALHCEYDTAAIIPWISHTMYGALANKVSVCQGYTLAYDYLLDKIGIKNRYCASSAMNHVWNIVTVDGEEYHVDITWDDPVYDITGRVMHNNFLVSTSKLLSNGHYATDDSGNAYYDYDDSPADTTYDNYFWQDKESAFIEHNGEIYYFDLESKNYRQYMLLKRYSDQQTLYKTEHYWMANGGYYPGNYARLSKCGTKLLFSLSDGIYSFNPQNSEVKKIHSKPDLDGYFNIYGFGYTDGMLVYDLCTSPNFDSDTKKKYEYKVPYHDAGNINNDGYLNLDDIVVLARAMAGWQVNANPSSFDVNGDGANNLKDLVHLSQYLADWEGIELH